MGDVEGYLVLRDENKQSVLVVKNGKEELNFIFEPNFSINLDDIKNIVSTIKF